MILPSALLSGSNSEVTLGTTYLNFTLLPPVYIFPSIFILTLPSPSVEGIVVHETCVVLIKLIERKQRNNIEYATTYAKTNNYAKVNLEQKD